MSGTDGDTWDVGFDEPSRIGGGEGASGHFKWGWNAQTGELTVWRVCGGRLDGPPFHDVRLMEAWGRPPSWSAGDLLGVATGDDTEGGDLTIIGYYGGPVPDSVVDWFTTAFPNHAVHSFEPPVHDA